CRTTEPSSACRTTLTPSSPAWRARSSASCKSACERLSSSCISATIRSAKVPNGDAAASRPKEYASVARDGRTWTIPSVSAPMHLASAIAWSSALHALAEPSIATRIRLNMATPPLVSSAAQAAGRAAPASLPLSHHAKRGDQGHTSQEVEDKCLLDPPGFAEADHRVTIKACQAHLREAAAFPAQVPAQSRRREGDDAVGDRHGDAQLRAELGDGRKPVRKVFGQVAVLQAVWGPGRPPDGGIVGHFVEAVALYTLIAVEAEIPLQQRNRLQPQLLYHREPLGVHRLRHPADGGRKTLVVEAPVAAHVLNAAGIHEHLRRVGDVVDVVEAGEKHIGRGGELVKVGQRRNHPRRVTGGDGGHRQSPLHAPDPDPVRAVLLAGEYERAALGDERHFVYA